MAGRKPAQAVRAFSNPIQAAVYAVLGPAAYVNVAGGYSTEKINTLFLRDGSPFQLKAPGSLTLDLIHHYRIIEAEGDRGPFKVSTVAWWYHIADETGDILGYHWHPWDVPFPHAHFYIFDRFERPDMTHMHFPTGRVSIEDILRLLVREFGVQPDNPDFEEVLARTEAAFRKYRTWP